MGKNIRRGRTGNVRCASCGQITRRDRAVYLFKDGIKAYYYPSSKSVFLIPKRFSVP